MSQQKITYAEHTELVTDNATGETIAVLMLTARSCTHAYWMALPPDRTEKMLELAKQHLEARFP